MFNYLKKLFKGSTTATLGGGATPDYYDPFARYERDDVEPGGISLLLAQPAAYHCIDLISNMVAKCKVHAYKSAPQGRIVDDEHNIEWILNHEWNPFQSPIDGLQSLVASALWAGNGYAFIKRDEGGNPESLFNLDPREVDITWECIGQEIVGVYYVLRQQGQMFPILQQDMIHIKNTTIGNGLFGVSVMDQLKGTFSHAQKLNSYATKYFDNGSHVNKYIKYPNWFTDEQEKEFFGNIEQLKAGLQNAHKLAVLPGGMELASLQLNNDEAQFIESKNLSDCQIAMIFGLSTNKVNSPTNTSHGSLSESEMSNLQEVYGKWFRKLEVEFNNKLYRASERKKRYVEFLREDLMSMDQKAKYEMAIAMRNNGLMTDDEIRLMMNLPKIEFAEGKFFGPANLIDPYAPPAPQPVMDQPPEAQPDVEEPQDTNTISEIANNAIERCKRRIIRSKNHDLSQHVEILIENLPGFNEEKIFEQVAQLNNELREVLPEQREGIIKEWKLKDI